MIKVGGIPKYDPQQIKALDDRKMRSIQLKNMAREEVEAKAIWADKQRKTYANMLQTSDPTKLEKVIMDEEEAATNDEFLQNQKAHANLLKIADEKNTEYIIDRLEPEEIAYMNVYFDSILRDIKKKFKKLDKDIFISFVKEAQSREPVLQGLYQDGDIIKVKQRFDLSKKGEKNQYEKELNNDIQQQKLDFELYLDEMKRQHESQRLKLEHDKRKQGETTQLKQILDNINIKKLQGIQDRQEVSDVMEYMIDTLEKDDTVNRINDISIDDPKTQLTSQPMTYFELVELAKKYGSPLPPKPPRYHSEEEIEDSIIESFIESKESDNIRKKEDKIVKTNMEDHPKINPADMDNLGNESELQSNKEMKSVNIIEGMRPNKSKAIKMAEKKYKEIVGDTRTTEARGILIKEVERIHGTFETHKMLKDGGYNALKEEWIRYHAEELQPQPEEYDDLFNQSPSFYKSTANNLYDIGNRFFEMVAPISPILPILPMTPELKNKKITKGDGLQKKKYYGKGSPQSEPKVEREYINDKYYIDMKKLKNNILSVKYSKTDANIPTLKVQNVPDGVKTAILSLINNGTCSTKGLKDTEKRLVRRFLKAVKLDTEFDVGKDEDDKFQNQFQILLGEYNAGNDSIHVKKSLKKFVLEGLQTNQIPRNQAMMLLYQLSL